MKEKEEEEKRTEKNKRNEKRGEIRMKECTESIKYRIIKGRKRNQKRKNVEGEKMKRTELE